MRYIKRETLHSWTLSITCLCSIYKLFTSVINKLNEHCNMNHILAEEQEVCIQKSLGCKQQLTIDAIILEQAHEKKHNILVCYVNHKKSILLGVPQLTKVLQIYKICPKIRNILQLMMRTRRTNLWVNNKSAGTVIQKGIFKGHLFSPLWFCLALNPMLLLLNTSEIGYKKNETKGGYHNSNTWMSLKYTIL